MRKYRLIALVACLLMAAVPALAQSEETTNLIYNGDFSVLSVNDTMPDGWYYDAWIPESSEYSAALTAEGEYALVLNNIEENDARFCQKVKVTPKTAYLFSCEIAADGLTGSAGASLSIMDTFVGSETLFATNGWQRVEFVGVTERGQKEITVALRVGGYGALGMGQARFKNISMVQLETVPSNAFPLKTQKASAGSTGDGEEKPQWAGIVVCVVLCAVLCAYVYRRGITQPAKLGAPQDYNMQIACIFVLAFFLRVFFSLLFVGHSTDIGCFRGWAEGMAEHGAAGFYSSGMFADYPPGYMYVLWLIGALRRLLGLSYDSALYILLLKLPSIAADFACAWIVYKIALKQNMTKSKAVLLLGLVALQPVFAFISGGWGQIDSILTLCLIGVLLLFLEKKYIWAGAVYGLAILLKPQALMAGPLLAVAYFVPEPNEKYARKLGQTALAVLAAVGVILLLAWPFSGGNGFGWLQEKYFSTATSYPYASVEAFNLFALLGGNWENIEIVPLLFSYGVWGMLFLALSVILAALLYIRAHKAGNRGALYLALAFLLIALFTLGPYMHERYLFPALALLLIAGVYYNDKRLFLCSLLFSITFLFNALCAFYIVDHQFARGAGYDLITFVGSLLSVLAFAYLCFVCYDLVVKCRNEPTALFMPSVKDAPVEAVNPLELPEPYERKLRYTKKDKLYCIGLTALYAVFALTNLGSLKAPQTEYSSATEGETAQLSFKKEEQISEIWVFGGITEGTLQLTTDHGETITFEQLHDDMFRWKRIDFGRNVKTLTLTTVKGELTLRELAFISTEGKLLTGAAAKGAAAMLVDEQNTIPNRPSYFTGMYFDELYHARTAYEHLHGLTPYENSHPPLGKIFIMLGVWVFGMNAFGWRVVGALFGIAMVPILYAFGKRLFKRPEYALLTAFLFAFDFMHFTQTRIATIDVYSIFFILLMYYYMYQYYCMNFFVDGLKATLKPLALAGVFFALGAATKWICIYAGIGLAVLLFMSLFKRFGEYRAALAAPNAVYSARVKEFPRQIILTLLWCCVFYIALPVAVYLLSYMPYYLCENHYTLKDIWEYQQFMWNYHSTLNASHPYESTWWQWPFTIRPMWYYFGDSEPAGMISTLTASGNPAVWWLCTPLTVALAVSRLRGKIRHEPGMTIVFIGALANYLPWVLVTRCTFIYHFFATVPFILFGGIYMLKWLEEKEPQFKWVKWAWMGVCLLLFLLLYPGLSGLPVPMWYAQILKFLPGGGLMYGA